METTTYKRLSKFIQSHEIIANGHLASNGWVPFLHIWYLIYSSSELEFCFVICNVLNEFDQPSIPLVSTRCRLPCPSHGRQAVPFCHYEFGIEKLDLFPKVVHWPVDKDPLDDFVLVVDGVETECKTKTIEREVQAAMIIRTRKEYPRFARLLTLHVLDPCAKLIFDYLY